MPTTFYRAFEDRLRGSRELIKERQKVYLPFLEPLKQIYTENQALDLGCGRGEWLEVLQEEGFQPHGVDLDEGMLEACQVRNLPAEQADAIAELERTPDASLSVVSGFHIAEHIPFSSLQQLVAQALRVLKPAGLLILETPNPENLVVGTNNFYLDPTHERPIPHLALNFLAEYSGFQRTKTLRLQEAPQLATETNLELMHVLGGSSPDYAIIAQKTADDEQLALFDEMFTKEYGLALDMLAWRYDSGLKSSIREIAEKVDSNTQKEVALSGQLDQLQSRAELLEQKAQNSDASIDLVRNQAQHAAELAARAQAGAASLELRAVQLEAVVDQLRLQLQEAGLRHQQAETRSQQAELALREWLSRASQAEARQAASEAINESLRQQVNSATSELLAAFKSQQKLELILEHTQQELATIRSQADSLRQERDAAATEAARGKEQIRQLEYHYELLSVQARNLAEQVSAEDMHARQLLEQAFVQADEQKTLLELELGELKRHTEMLEGECEEAKREYAGASEQVDHLETQLNALNLQLNKLTAELSAVNNHKHQIHSDLLSAEAYKHSLHASLVGLEDRMHTIQHQLNESLGNAHHWWQQAVEQEKRVKALLGSTSWRITWPLRAISYSVSWIASLPIRLVKATARPLLHMAMRTVLGRPTLRARLARMIQRHPKLHQHLRLFAKRRNLISDFPPVDTNMAIHDGYSSPQQETVNHPSEAPKGPDLSALSAEARRYFQELNSAIEQQKPGSL